MQSKMFQAVVFIPKRTRFELSSLESKCMYFQDYDYAVRKGVEKMYQPFPFSPTSKILKSNRSNRKREYAARTQFDSSNLKR